MPQIAEHTRGSWTVEPLQWDHGASLAIVVGRAIICTIAPLNEDEEPDMYNAVRGPHDEANARLIAAAPELLYALMNALDVMEAQNVGNGGSKALARAAIAKAVQS